MPKNRNSGTLWLSLGILAGLFALLVFAFGAFAVWHTHGNVRQQEDFVDRSMQELNAMQPVLHLPQNQAKVRDLMDRVRAGEQQVADFKSDRVNTFLILGFSILPGGLAAVFICIYFVKRQRVA